MKHNSSAIPGAATMILIALAILFLPWLGETLFNSKGEPREAIVAVSMLQSGNWILPVNYGGDIPFKPPFLAWLIAGLSWLFNGGVVNEYLSRLPSTIAAILMVIAGFSWARRERNVRFAMIFSIVTITSFEVFRAAMACRLDMVLTACMVGAIYMLYDLREHKCRHRWLRYLAVIILLTCATLTKGPIGALLPCFVVGVYRLLRHDRFFPTLFAMLALVAASFIIPAWWYYEAYLLGGQEFVDLALEENIGRLTGTMSYESHVEPIWYNFMTLAAGLLPWTLLLIFSLFSTRKLKTTQLSTAGLFSLTAFIVIVGFYCIPESKRSVYLLPAYPFACYAITHIIETLATARPVKILAWIVAILAVIVPIAYIALMISGINIGRITFNPIPWWAYFIVVIPIISGCAWFVNRHSPVGHLMVAVWSIYLCYTAVVMPSVLNPQSDYKLLDKFVGNKDVYTLTDERLYTLNFYLNDRIRLIENMAEASKLPSGTLVIYPEWADTAGCYNNFDIELLTERGCDHRRKLYIATKK